jgi:hypothetical protein
MENASKALIIAGAILLSILIIALGVFVFNQAKSAMGNVNMNDQEIAAFNSKFESYEGKQKGSNVRALVKIVRNYNNTLTDPEYVDIIKGTEAPTGTVEFKTSDVNYQAVGNDKILAGSTYRVSFAYNKAGQISARYINE